MRLLLLGAWVLVGALEETRTPVTSPATDEATVVPDESVPNMPVSIRPSPLATPAAPEPVAVAPESPAPPPPPPPAPPGAIEVELEFGSLNKKTADKDSHARDIPVATSTNFQAAESAPPPAGSSSEPIVEPVLEALNGDIAEPSMSEQMALPPVLPDWARFAVARTTIDLDFLYWQNSDPREKGRILSFQTQTTPPGTIVGNGGFTTGHIRPDNEMGARLFWSRELVDRVSVELGGFWLFPFEYVLGATNSVTQQQSLTPGQVTIVANQVFFVVSDPDLRLQAGRVFYQIKNYGAESNAKLTVVDREKLRVDGLVGVYYVGFQDQFDSLMVPFGTTNRIAENFEATNSVVGGQIGIDADYSICTFVGLKGFTKLGVGANFEDLRVRGPAAGTGLLTGIQNLGTTSRAEANAMVNVGFMVSLRFTPNIEGNLGYSAIWLSDVLRAMDQLDLNPAAVSNPVLNLNTQSMLVGGFIGGVTVRF